MRPGELWASIEGVGFWATGLPSWESAKAFVANGTLAPDAPARPSPQLLAPNERRRAPESVAVALQVALAACQAAGRDPSTLPSVFASTHGDLAVTNYMCATLASDPRAVSPIKFHNSVHNAASGYWTIGVGAMKAATALSAYETSFAQGLVEAISLLAAGDDAVLLVAYDTHATGALAEMWRSDGLLGAALVLSRTPMREAIRLRATAATGGAVAPSRGPLAAHFARNAMAPMLALFDALAANCTEAELHAGPKQLLRVELSAAAHDAVVAG